MSKILYVGPLWSGSTSEQRKQALCDLGHQVTAIDIEPPAVLQKSQRLLSRLQYRLLKSGMVPGFRGVPDRAKANQQVVQAIQQDSYDLIWLDKGLTITAATLMEVKLQQPGCRIVGYCCDDILNKGNQSPQLFGHLGLYDVFFTTKSFNVEELEKLGCRRPVFIMNSYDPATHRPLVVAPQERTALGGGVGFIGAWEEERNQTMYSLAVEGVAVRVWGGGWHKARHKHPNLIIEGRPLWGDLYAKSIASFDICLGFLCKANRDLQTQRSIEIPACQGFLLAERTSEHSALFEEGKEAEFFGSYEELVRKVKYYLAQPDRRNQIAAVGRQRCLRSGYSNQERLKWALTQVLG